MLTSGGPKGRNVLTSGGEAEACCERLLAAHADGDVVAGVGGVGGELGVEDFGGVGHGAELGYTGGDVVVDAGVAVALHEGDVDANVRVGVLDHGVGADGRDGAGYGSVDGGSCGGAHIEGAGLGAFPSRGVHYVVV